MHDLVAHRPPGVTPVLVVGGSRVAVLGLTSKGVYEGNGIEGLALGTLRCGLTSPGSRCGAVPDDLRALGYAFRARTIVLMPDEGDLVGFNPGGSGPHGAGQVRARLERIWTATRPRRLVVVPIPCAAGRSPLGGSFDAVVRTWARRHAVTVGTDVPTGCTAGNPVGAAATWAAIAELAR
jgi:hypothetical protein